MRFLISAGEASGELYGAGLIRALRARARDAQCFGVGGHEMRDAGFECTIDAHEISVVGLAEVVTHLPRIYRRFQALVHEAKRRQPDAAILIDFPDFNLRLARKLHELHIPVIYYVSPQLWAWRPGRIEQIKRYVQKMLVIFPFEERFYREHDVVAQYVGHPLADMPLATVSREAFANEHKLDPNKTWIALLPGSRRKEFELNAPGIIAAADQLSGPNNEFMLPVASGLERKWVIKQLRVAQCSGLPGIPVTLVPDAWPALIHSRAAIVASGTATLQTALIGTPFVMVYRVSPLTWALGRRLVKVDRFAMPNLIAGRDVVPEFVQGNFQPATIAAKVRQLLVDGPERQAMIEELADVRARLRPTGTQTASERAADLVLATVRQA